MAKLEGTLLLPILLLLFLSSIEGRRPSGMSAVEREDFVPVTAAPTVITVPATNTGPAVVTVPSTAPGSMMPTLQPPVNMPPLYPVTTPVTVPSVYPMPTPSTVPTYTPAMPTPIYVPVMPVTNPVTAPATYPVTTPAATYYPYPQQGAAPAGTVPATTMPAAPASSGQTWCVARTGMPDAAVQDGLDYACGIGGADCSAIQPMGSCFNPNSLQAHASYAFNYYYQKNPSPASCNFGGSAMLVTVNPSSGTCVYQTSSSGNIGYNSVPVPTTTPAVVAGGGAAGVAAGATTSATGSTVLNSNAPVLNSPYGATDSSPAAARRSCLPSLSPGHTFLLASFLMMFAFFG